MLKNQIAELLKKELPGEKAQFLMAPEGRRNFKENPLKQFAAVMLLLYPKASNLYTIYIKRPDYEGIHGGQISFPGGKLEVTDKNLEHTAIRETHEELGLLDKPEILGKLSPLFIPVSGFEVHPFVGYLDHEPNLAPDPIEVDQIIQVSIQKLLDPTLVNSETWNLHGMNLEVPFYKIDSYKIWGATAMITSEFLEIIKKYPLI